MQRKWRQEMLNEAEKVLQRVDYEALMEVRSSVAEQWRRQSPHHQEHQQQHHHQEQLPETPPERQSGAAPATPETVDHTMPSQKEDNPQADRG